MSENILNAANKSFRIFRLLDKNDSYFQINVKLKRPKGICFMPIVKTRKEVGDLVQKFFGSKGFQNLFQNYIFNFKFQYQPALIAGKKVIYQNRAKIMKTEALTYLPRIRTLPTHKILNSKNAILDYTDQFNLIEPRADMMQKQPVIKYSEYIYPELITRFGIAYEKPELFKWTSKYKSTQVKPYLFSNFDSIIIPIEVSVTDNSLVNMYIDYHKTLPLAKKKNINDLKFISLVRMIYRAYAKDIEDISSDEYKYFITEMMSKNVVFFFYNRRFSFAINFKELYERKVKTSQFRNLFKSRLIMLISNNLGIEADYSLDKLIEEDFELDKTETTHVEKTLDVNLDSNSKDVVDKKTTSKSENDTIKDNIKSKRDEEITKLISKNILKRKPNISSVSYKNKTNDLLDKISSLETVDKNVFDKMTKEIENNIEPIEDILETENNKTKLLKKNLVKTVKVVNSNNIEILKGVVEVDPEIDDDEENLSEPSVEGTYDENGFLIEDSETPIEFEEDDSDIPEELIEDNRKTSITVSSDGNVTDEEKLEILKEINKRYEPKRSDKQLRRIALVKDKYKSIKLSDDRSIEELLEDIKSKEIETKVNSTKTVIDKSVETNNLQDFERSYINNTMQQDIIKTLKSFDNIDKSNPMHIISYDEIDSSDRFNLKKTITVKFEDDNQKQHIIKFDIPVPSKDGILMMNGNKKVLKKQITLRPIVKINPSRLAITTFYNKVLMYRQGTVLNRRIVLLKKIVEDVLVQHPTTFSLKYGNNLKSNKNYLTSIEYDEIAKIYHKFIVGKKGDRTVIFFNQNEIRSEIKTLGIPYVSTVSSLPIAIDYSKKEIIEYDTTETEKSVIDHIMSIINEKSYYPEIETVNAKVKAPKKRIYSRITIQSFDVPTISFLSALFGLSNIVRLSGLKYTFTSEKLQEGAKERDWLSVKFKDGILYYPEYPYNNSLLFNGLNEMVTEEYYFDQFDEHVPYMDYCAKVLKTRNVFKGWYAFKDLFIDDVTRDILRDEKLPTDFLELFLYANDLLVDNAYSNETEASSYRIRGFELYSVALYKSIADEYRKYIQKEGRANTSISIPRDAIIKKLVDSQILETYDTINPINELKMKCGCSVKGNGLSGANTNHGYGMDRRAFGEDAVGIFAESNVDNHNVGIVKQLTNNVKIVNTRGYLDTTKDPKKIQKLTASQRMSPDELIMPSITKYDSPNRVAFASAQWKHTMPMVGGGDPPLIGSGYEKVIAKDIGATYCLKAEEDCIVLEINEETKSIIVELKDGKKKAYNYGTDFMKNGNILLENNFELNVEVGKKIKADDIIAYSKEFFKKTAGNDITFTMGRLCRIALMDDYFTEEDSSLVTEHLSKKMSSSVTHSKTISISGKANIIKCASVGQHVKDGDSIMLFEDEKDEDVNTSDITSILSMLGDADEEAIERMSYHSPKANASGEISKIEVYWTGELEDMSETVRDFVKAYISNKKKISKYEEKMTGEKSDVELNFKKVVPVFGKVNGIEIDENNGIIIEFFITHTLPYGQGDKLSFFPAIKSVTCQVTQNELCPYAEDGKIDSVMGLVSLSNRQVNSPYFIGACGKVLMDMSKRIAAEYLGK